MISNTKTATLPSGVEFEVKELGGKEQRLLTEGDKSHTDKLNEMLKSILIRVGSVQGREIDDKFISSLLSEDKRYILAFARQFSLDFEESFIFQWEYLSKSTKSKEVSEQEITLSMGNFPFVSPNVIVVKENEEGESKVTLVPMPEYFKNTGIEFPEYSDVLALKTYETLLPRSGEKVRLHRMDGVREELAGKIKQKDAHANSAIELRHPLRFDSETNTPINLNLDNLSLRDIEHLRKLIKQVEGSVDTEIMFEHPEAELMAPDEKIVTIDLIGTTAFFFPSGAI